jgi:hypothetical protein
MKMMLSKNTLFGEDITSIGVEAAQLPEKELGSAPLQLPSLFKELREKYIRFLHDQFKFSKKYRIVMDTGNGMAGAVARDVFKPYASELEIIYEEVDCRFPNHEADPTVVANLKDLRAKVLEKRADIGFAFDGDGDRLGLITSSGRILWGDEIVMLLSELVLTERPGATIIGEVKCSEKLFRMIEARGGNPLMYKTGHSLIKKKMKEVTDLYHKIKGDGQPQTTEAGQPDAQGFINSANIPEPTPTPEVQNLKAETGQGIVGKTVGFLGGLSGTEKLGQGAGYAISNALGTQESNIQAQNKGQDIQTSLIQRIREKKARGEDTTKLQKALDERVQERTEKRWASR